MDIVETFEIAARSLSVKVVRSSLPNLDRTVSDILHSKGAWGIVSDSRRVFLEEFVRVDAAEAECRVVDAELGIASTGSLVLPVAVDRLPPVHIVILAVDRIVPSMSAAISIGMHLVSGRDGVTELIIVVAGG